MRTPTPTIIRQAIERQRSVLGDQAGPDSCREASIVDYAQQAHGPLRNARSQRLDIFEREETPKGASWALCWSDLMMTMFVMFAFLYIFQMPRHTSQPDPDTPRIETVPVNVPVHRPEAGFLLDRIHDQIHNLIEQQRLHSLMSVHFVPGKSIHVLCRGNLFDASADMAATPAFTSALRELGTILQTAPHAVAVVGHSDPGEYSQKSGGPWGLSTTRAARVAEVLVTEGRLAADRIYIVGYGDQRPGSVPGAGRVEVVLSAETPTEPMPEIAQAAEAAAADGFRQWLTRSTQENQ